MNLQQTFHSIIDEYKSFIQGRASRAQIWWIFAVLNGLPLFIFVASAIIGSAAMMILIIPYVVYCVVVILPLMALMVQRLHDINKSGWWMLLMLLPVIGWIALMVLWALKGQAEDNQFGSNPLVGRQYGFTFKEAHQSAYQDFLRLISGRIRRSQYWYCVLIWVITAIGFQLVPEVVGQISPITGDVLGFVLSIPSMIWTFVSYPAMFAFPIRRLHDVNKSAWWSLLVLIPIVGWIILLIWDCTKGTAGANRFGPDPLAEPRIG